MVVLAALAWVVYAIVQKNLVQKYPAQQLNLVIFGAPALALLPFADIGGLLSATTQNWLLLGYTGVNTLVAYGLLAEAFKHLEVSRVGIIITLNPILTMIIMEILERNQVDWIEPERISFLGIFGAAFIVLGAVLAVKSSSTEEAGSGIGAAIKLKKEVV